MKNPTYLLLLILATSCTDGDDYVELGTNEALNQVTQATFGNRIDFANLENYGSQSVPAYITKDNSGNNTIVDDKATLGRILFYDTNLSTDNNVSCASCHDQSMGFSDASDVSLGVNGVTARHSMRLINTRFAAESRFFWDERAVTLEEQTTQPIQDHAEMGFSGQDGNPDLLALIDKLSQTDYYSVIFEHIYGDPNITEARLQESMAQFIRSIQSFDSRFDEGLTLTANLNAPFPNYTAQENQGKALFVQPQQTGGAGCMGCHAAPEFDIDPNSRNNGVTGIFNNPSGIDLSITRAPSLRDVFNSNGELNGKLMHDASLATVMDVIQHYNSIDAVGNPNLDLRLQGTPGQNGQQLNLSVAQMEALEAFLKTLSGNDVYTNPKWSNPFL
ncbi:MAG: cytochrome-c peroxidase [Nonlabens sp.]